jgi:hypothetical protein
VEWKKVTTVEFSVCNAGSIRAYLRRTTAKGECKIIPVLQEEARRKEVATSTIISVFKDRVLKTYGRPRQKSTHSQPRH